MSAECSSSAGKRLRPWAALCFHSSADLPIAAATERAERIDGDGLMASLHMIHRAHAPVSADIRKHMPSHQASSGRIAMLHMTDGSGHVHVRSCSCEVWHEHVIGRPIR
jgi:hypothetical protein